MPVKPATEYVIGQPANTIFYSDWHCHVLKLLRLIIRPRDRLLMSKIRITLADTDNDYWHIPPQTDAWQTHITPPPSNDAAAHVQVKTKKNTRT